MEKTLLPLVLMYLQKYYSVSAASLLPNKREVVFCCRFIFTSISVTHVLSRLLQFYVMWQKDVTCLTTLPPFGQNKLLQIDQAGRAEIPETLWISRPLKDKLKMVLLMMVADAILDTGIIKLMN